MSDVEDAVNYVLKHRKNKVFRGLSPEQIRGLIVNAAEKREFVTVESPEGLCGVLVARADHDKKELFIKHVLTTARGALKAMLVKFHEWYPGWTLAALRRNKPVRYNTPRLVHLLEVA